MIKDQYVYEGLCGMAHAHPAGTMAGHLGAAVLAGYFFGEDQSELPQEVFQGVEGELERIKAGEEAIWFNAKNVGLTPTQLFRALQEKPGQAIENRSLSAIADALKASTDKLRQSGHNVIFASIAIRALHEHDKFATPAMIEGISRLMTAFATTSEGRGYYGKQIGWKSGNEVQLNAAALIPVYQTIPDMAVATLRELIQSGPVKKQGYGGLWHVINHAAAIVELDRYGYRELAADCLVHHHRHLCLWQDLPEMSAELGPAEKSQLHPREPAYWQGMFRRDQALLTHRIKTLYGYHVLCRVVADQELLQNSDEALLWLMA